MQEPKLSRLRGRNISGNVAQFRAIPQKKLTNQLPDFRDKSSISASSGLEPYLGLWNESAQMHLLKRTLFGFKSSDLMSIQSLNLNQAVELILTLDPEPAPPVNDYHYPEEGIIDPDVAPGESWIEAPYNNDYEGARLVSLKGWIINNMLEQPTSIHEKMILFWHNLLVTQSWGVFIAKASYQYFKTLRTHALGNFKQLVKAITLDPSMLIYLNGTFNNKEAPDENYARELQELFCVGKGPNSKFTESDVQAAAKVLTGWVVSVESLENEGKPQSFYYPPFHEESDKTFSEFYENRIIVGKSGPDGEAELDELLDMIFENEETALYLSRRIYQFFVYNEIDDFTEQNVIVPLAQLLRENDYDVKPVLTSLFNSAHFYDPANRGAVIKNPADFLIGTWKALEISRLGTSNSLNRLLNHRSMLWNMADQGMEIGDPPSVSGWPAYYQAPQFDKYWITTDTITSRAIMTDSLWYWGFWVSQDLRVNADLIQIVSQLNEQLDSNLMLREITSKVFGISMDDSSLQHLKTVLLNGQSSDAYWTSAWLQLQADPGNQEIRSVVENRLKATFQHIFQMGESQLM